MICHTSNSVWCSTHLLLRPCRWGLGPMAQRKKQLIAEGKLDKHGRPNAETPPEYLRALPDAGGSVPTSQSLRPI